MITHDAYERFVTNISQGAVLGFRYFRFLGVTRVTVTARGDAQGWLELSTAYGPVGAIAVAPSKGWAEASAIIDVTGQHELSLTFRGTGQLDLLALAFDTHVGPGAGRAGL